MLICLLLLVAVPSKGIMLSKAEYLQYLYFYEFKLNNFRNKYYCYVE